MVNQIFITALASMIAMVIAGDVQTASIVDEVKFTDAPPQLKPVRVSKDQDYSGETLPDAGLMKRVSHTAETVLAVIWRGRLVDRPLVP